MTKQVGECIHYDGREMSMCTQPLDDYFAQGGINPGLGQAEWCTASWRGYVGTWEVADRRLYLVALQGTDASGRGANLETVFPGNPDRVFAHWYTGTLLIPEGDTLKNEDLNDHSTVGCDMMIDVERGVICDVRIAGSL